MALLTLFGDAHGISRWKHATDLHDLGINMHEEGHLSPCSIWTI
jgi:hypothetical protein